MLENLCLIGDNYELYYNLSGIDDVHSNVSEVDKQFNKLFFNL